MRIRELHRWDLTPAEAREVQERLRGRLEREDRLGEVRFLAGVDVSIDRRRRLARAAVAVLAYPGLELADSAVVDRPLTYPYVPGLLSFREIPSILDSLRGLRQPPDLILCDGQGYAHPRRFGLACHLGVLIDTPSIGVAKSRLIGSHEEPPGQRGGRQPLLDDGEEIGAVVRTRAGVRPVYVSIGHRVSLDTAVEWVLRAAPRFRLPETTRCADRLASLC